MVLPRTAITSTALPDSSTTWFQNERLALSILQSNLIRSIEFDSAIARRLKRAHVSRRHKNPSHLIYALFIFRVDRKFKQGRRPQRWERPNVMILLFKQDKSSCCTNFRTAITFSAKRQQEKKKNKLVNLSLSIIFFYLW